MRSISRKRAAGWLAGSLNLGVATIIVNHGLPESLKDVVQQALDKGIKVAAFDVDLANPKVPQIEQSDERCGNGGVDPDGTVSTPVGQALRGIFAEAGAIALYKKLVATDRQTAAIIGNPTGFQCRAANSWLKRQSRSSILFKNDGSIAQCQFADLSPTK